MLRGRVRRFFNLIGFAAIVVVGAAIAVFLVVADTRLVVRSGSSTLPAAVIGATGALACVLAAFWYRSRADRLSRTARRFLGSAGMAWGALFVIAFWLTHRVHRDEEDASPLTVGVVTYCLVIILAAFAVLPFAVRRLARPPVHRQSDGVRVMYVRDKEPFLRRVLRLRVGRHRVRRRGAGCTRQGVPQRARAQSQRRG